MSKEQDYGRNKYLRNVYSIHGESYFVIADVYSVLEAFAVVCPARQHAIKKLLCAGIRGKGDAVQDLKEAKVAMDRAIDLETIRQKQQSPDVYPPIFLKDNQQDDGKIQVAIGPLSSVTKWEVFLVTDKGNSVGYRVGWPCEDGTTFLVRHYMAGETAEGPSLDWCKNAAARDAAKFNKEGKRPEEWIKE